MRFLLQTLSVSYFRRHIAKTLLTLTGVVVGVATFSSIKAAQRTLVGGIHHTIDRMAGKAHLQVSGAAGVPEELQDRIRDVPGVLAVAPVIEQVVVPEPAELGSILVLGVDLLGDREMRQYSFEGEDADLDDPLLFLAQPDSIALSTAFAHRAGVRTDDALVLKTGGQRRRVVVRGLLGAREFTEAYGGNIAVTDVYAAQELFGRGRQFDRIEVRLAEGLTLDEGRARLRTALGPGFEVETPSRRGSQVERLIANFSVGFDITSLLALGIGAFLIFNTFTVSVNRRRRDIGVLRALGATPRQIQILFLSEAAVLGLIGGALGFVAGAFTSEAFLRLMRDAVHMVYGVSDASHVHITPWLVLEALALGVLASLAGAWAPARAASRVRPTEALASGTHASHAPRASGARFILGVLSLGAATALTSISLPIDPLSFVYLIMLLGLTGMTLIVSPAARVLLQKIAPLVARISPVTGRLASDSLLSHSRRTAGTVSAITLSLAFVLGTAGYVGSVRGTLTGYLDDIITSDLFVRGSTNVARPDYRFDPALRQELLAIPGVRAVECYRNQRVRFRGEDIMLLSLEIDGAMQRIHWNLVEGDEESMARGLIHEGRCAVSENFARLYDLHLGDVVELPCPTGTARLPIAAVLIDYSSDRGSILIDRAVFVSLWQDDRVDIFDVNLERSEEAEVMRVLIHQRLADRAPALISTRREFVEEVGRYVDSFYQLVQMTVMMALVVAFMGIVTSLLVSVVERTREIGILKALGALGGQIRRSVAYEGLVSALAGLVLSLPLADLISRFLGSTVALVFAGWQMPYRYPVEILAQLVVALPIISFLASWIPARQAAAIKVTEAISYE